MTAAGEGSCLAVLSPASADAGLIAYEMAVLVKRVGPASVGASPAGRWPGMSRGELACRRPKISWLDEDARARWSGPMR